MPVSDPEGFRCPRCASRDLEKSVVIIDLEMDAHDAFRCKKCHLEFTVWG
jgi:transposase-like protein